MESTDALATQLTATVTGAPDAKRLSMTQRALLCALLDAEAAYGPAAYGTETTPRTHTIMLRTGYGAPAALFVQKMPHRDNAASPLAASAPWGAKLAASQLAREVGGLVENRGGWGGSWYALTAKGRELARTLRVTTSTVGAR